MTAQVYHIDKQQEHVKQLLFACNWCIKPQIMTTNGKCKRCGSPIKNQKYWKHTANIMKLISHNKSKGHAIEINDRVYFVPNRYFDELALLTNNDWKEIAIIVEKIKRDCPNYAYK